MSSNGNGTRGKTILLVDDDLDDRELFVEALSSINDSSEVCTLEGSEELFDYLQSVSTLPDYLFLDLNMPRKSGKECLREIQSHDHLRRIKVVIYSTSLNPKDVAETYEHGAFCFIQKPNSFSDLKQVLIRVITSEAESYPLNNGYIISSQ